MTQEFDFNAVYTTLAAASEQWFREGRPGARHEYQARAVMALVEELAEEVRPAEAVIGSPLASIQDIRMVAYDLAIKSGSSHGADHLHELAGKIADNISEGFDPKETLTAKLDVDTSAADAEIKRRAAILKSQGETIERQQALIVRQQDALSAQRQIMDENQPILLSIFGRTEWRREAWNDLKAVVLSEITERLKGHVCGDIMENGLTKHQLRLMRSFIASFNFDPEKP